MLQTGAEVQANASVSTEVGGNQPRDDWLAGTKVSILYERAVKPSLSFIDNGRVTACSWIISLLSTHDFIVLHKIRDLQC